MDEQERRRPSPEAPRANGWLFPATALALALVAAVAWSLVKPKTSAMSVPAPTAVVSDPTPSPLAFIGTEGITFNFERSGSMPYGTARVDVHRHDHDLALKVSLTPEAKGSAAQFEGQSTVSLPWSVVTPDDRLEFAVIPGYVKNVASLNHGRIQIVYLANVGMSALAIERDRTNSAAGFFWSDYGGGIHNSRNETLPSATVVAGDYAITVYEDTNQGVWGYFDGVVNVLEPMAREPVEALRVVMYAESSDPAGFERLSWLGLLPPGATDPDVVADRSVIWGSARLGGTGRLVVAGYTDVVERRRTGVHSISYTDASGARRTVKH